MDETKLIQAFQKIKKDMNILTTKINIVKGQQTTEKDFRSAINELQVMVDEKIRLEISNLKLEMKEEIAKMYEKLFELDTKLEKKEKISKRRTVEKFEL